MADNETIAEPEFAPQDEEEEVVADAEGQGLPEEGNEEAEAEAEAEAEETLGDSESGPVEPDAEPTEAPAGEHVFRCETKPSLKVWGPNGRIGEFVDGEFSTRNRQVADLLASDRFPHVKEVSG